MIEVNKAYKVLILILLGLQFYFFDIIPKINELLINVNSEYSKKLEFVIFILMVIITLFSSNVKKNTKRNFALAFNFLLVAIFSIGIASSIVYKQSVFNTIGTYYSYYLVLAYFPFSFFLSNKNNMNWFYDVIVRMSFCYLILQTVQGLIYRLTHTVFLFYTPVALQNLNILQRFTEGTEIVTFVAVLISLKPFLIKEKWNIMDYSTLFLIVTFHFFLSQGRMYLIIAVLSITLSVIFQLCVSRYRSVFFVLSPLIGVISVIFWGKFISILDFTGTSGVRSASYIIRTYSYEYFYNHFFYNKWFGIGFADPNQYQWLLKGSIGFDAGGGLMTYQDVGIVGTTAILGISSLIFFGVILFSLIIFLLKGKNKEITIIIFMYITVSLISLSPLDTGRIFPFILLLAISDYSQNMASDT